MKLYLEKRVLLGFCAALGIILWLGVYSYKNNQKFAATSKLIAHTNEVLFYIEQVLTAVISIENQQNKFVIISDAQFLNTLSKTKATINNHLKKLTELTRDNELQQKNIQVLKDLIQQRTEFLDQVLEDRKTDFKTAQQRISSYNKSNAVDRIWIIVDEMKAEENQLLNKRIKSSEKDFREFNYGFIQLLVAIAAVLTLVFFGINYNLRARSLAEKALVQSSLRTQDLYENAPCGYHSLNADGIFVDINKTLLTWLGYERQEVINKLKFRDVIGVEALSAFEENFKIFKAQRYIHNLEFQLIRKDGSTFPVIVNSSGIVDEKGNFERSRSTVFDLTERKLAEDKIGQLNKELEAFTYSVSHDLRAPLRSIDGYTRILEEDYGALLDDEGKRVMNVIMNNAKRMGQLIDDLLDFSRIGRKELSKSMYNPDNLVRSIVKELSESEQSRKIEFIIHPLLQSQADVSLIRQVWINLISNALKYTRKVEEAVIEINSYKQENEIIYSIKDNGVGFDMKYAHKLFGVFQRLHKMQDFEGTGVGLAIVSRSISKHDGRVWAEAALNEGATFYFSLPIKTF